MVISVWISTAVLHLWSGRIGPLLVPNMGFGIGIWTGISAIWMWYSSRYGKVREREHLLDAIAWRGDEQVLDVGCGRGLMLIRTFMDHVEHNAAGNQITLIKRPARR